MAEVTPSNPKGNGAAAILGGMVGFILAIILSLFGLSFAGWGLTGEAGSGRCGGHIVAGIVLLAAVAGLAWLAWYMVFRNKARGFGADFLRGLSAVVALFLLIPWPCSYTWGAYAIFATCTR